MDRKLISYKRFNPNYWHVRKAMQDINIRFMFLIGGSSSAKTVSVVQAIVVDTINSGDNTLILRKVGASISDSIYNDFKTEIDRLNFNSRFTYTQNTIKCDNGAEIRFKGLDDSEKIKGVSSFKRVVMDELSEFDEDDYNQMTLRLRGIVGQQIIAMFNPISENHWIKKSIFDKEELTEMPTFIDGIRAYEAKDGKILKRFTLKKEFTNVTSKLKNAPKQLWNDRTKSFETHPSDMLIIKSTYLNNFWVNGSPCGTYGYYDRQTIANFDKLKSKNNTLYMIYALGEWGTIKTGGEFLTGFDQSKHVKRVDYTRGLPIFISIDNNVLPYISILFFQLESGDVSKLKQIHEIAAKDPFNTATKAATLASTYLNGLEHDDLVYLVGDQTTKANNTIDDEKRSFFDKFKEVLDSSFRVKDIMPSSNPSVSMTGEFVNAIFDGEIPSIDIEIDSTCVNAIDDYANAKKDANGSILKRRVTDKQTKQSYEEHGHMVDCLRYVVTQIFKDKFIKFSLSRKYNKAQEEYLKYYNVLPDDGILITQIAIYKGGTFVAIFSKYVKNRAYIYDTVIGNVSDKSILAEKINKDSLIVNVECSEQWFQFVKQLRDETKSNIRIIKEATKQDVRVSAFSDVITNSFYFKDEPSEFINDILDYKEGKNIEAINCLTGLAFYLQRNYNLK